MFIEDVRNGIMPIGGNSHNYPDFSVLLEPSHSDADKVLCWALSTDRYIDHSLENALSEFIAHCAMHLVYKGEVYYEIVRDDLAEFKRDSSLSHDKLPDDTKHFFRLVYIPGSIVKMFAYYLQIIPRVEWLNQKRFFIALPLRDVWTIKLPPRLGNRSSHRELLRTLVRHSSPMPEFVKFDPKDDTSMREFNFSEFHMNKDLRVAMETALWGWPARTLWQKRTMEHHAIYRHLRFAHSLAILREHILFGINDLLKRVNFPSRLIIKGLPTSGDFEQTMHQMELGNISLEDALKRTDLL
jgi:hypothetical protein